jgi:hypothetical protein
VKIIGLGHLKYSGKDTVAKMINTEYRINNPGACVIRKGFADKLKDVSYELFAWAGMKPRQYYEQSPSNKEDFLPAIQKTVRDVWIDVGCRMREVYPGIWIDNLILGTHADLLLIPDVRFPNEVTAIKANGGTVVKINRPSIKPTLDEADQALHNFNGWDYQIENTRDLAHLQNEVLKFLETWNGTTR